MHASHGKLDIHERGRAIDGEPATLDRRLFVQLHVFTGNADVGTLTKLLAEHRIAGVLYESATDPYDIGLLTFDENPAHFPTKVRALLHEELFARLEYRREYQMFGRTYARGYEADLEEALIYRPVARLLDPELCWAVWYPLRRSGSFELLEPDEQRKILSEHGSIGHTYGKAGVAHDVRLASHGLNRDDNDFVIGILGAELFPLSAVVQDMRSTRQTAQYLTRLGPFFVGHVVWQSERPS